MSVTSGFFNSIEGDRKYTAEQMAAIFDGIIQEGVYHSIGNKFAVTVSDGENFVIAVDSGRAWLNNTWILNDAATLYTLDLPELLLSRIDAIVLKADRSSEVRQGTIEIIKGAPSSTPQKPTWTDTAEVKRMAIAYVTLGPNAQSISQSNIEYVVGLDDCPYVTSVLEKISVEELFNQWKAQWDEWSTEERTEFSEWMEQEKVDFVAWFEGLQVILDDDVATALSNRLLVLEHDCIVGGEDPENPDVDIEFESADTELQPTTTESVELLDSTDIWTVRLHKISQMFKNIRYLLKMMGSTDISSIGNGTVTGALTSLNGNLSSTSLTRTWVNNEYIDQTSFNRTYASKYGKLICVFLNIVFTASMPTGTSDVVIGKITGMTLGRSYFFLIPSQNNNSSCLFQLRSNGELWVSNLSGTATGTTWFRTTLVVLEDVH